MSSLVIEDVTDREGVIVVRARTASGPVLCPRCGARTGHAHGYYERTVADVPADGRPVVVRVRVRRMRCPVAGCPVQTFREQVPGVLDRYQRRTTRLAGQAAEVARRLDISSRSTECALVPGGCGGDQPAPGGVAGQPGAWPGWFSAPFRSRSRLRMIP